MKWYAVIALIILSLTVLAFLPFGHTEAPYQIIFPSGQSIETRCPWAVTNGVAYLAYSDGYQMLEMGGQVFVLKVPDRAPDYVEGDCY